MRTLLPALYFAPLVALALVAAPPETPAPHAPLPLRHVEKLGRGVVAVHQGDSKVFVSWRLLATDPDSIASHVYRASGDADPVKLTTEPLTKATCFADAGVKPPAGATAPLPPDLFRADRR